MSKEAMKLAARSLKELVPDDSDHAPAIQGQRKRQENAIKALQEALAQQEPKLPEFYAQLEYDTPGWDVVAAVYQRHGDATPLLVHRETLPNQQPAHPPLEMTPEMMRKVQMHSELGAYAAANLSGAYDLFQEFWRVAMSVAPQPAQQQEPVHVAFASNEAEHPEDRYIKTAHIEVKRYQDGTLAVGPTPLPDMSPVQQEPVAWPIETNNQVEVLAKQCGWDNRRYMTSSDYQIWCDRMRQFAQLASPPAQRKPLTDEQLMEMWRTTKFRGNGGQVDWFIEGTRAAEAAHGIKEQP